MVGSCAGGDGGGAEGEEYIGGLQQQSDSPVYVQHGKVLVICPSNFPYHTDYSLMPRKHFRKLRERKPGTRATTWHRLKISTSASQLASFLFSLFSYKHMCQLTTHY